MSAPNAPNPTKLSKTDPEKRTQDMDEHAWKHIGYPGFCEFSALDDDFFLLRRFGALNHRVLLDLQFQITQLEAQLARLDQACRDDANLENPASRMDSLAWDNSQHNERRRRGELVRELQPLLHKYNKQIAFFTRIKERDKATFAQRRNIRRWFKDHVNAVYLGEQEYIERSSDLMSMWQSPKSSMQIFCERLRLVKWAFYRKPKKLPGFERGVRVGSDAIMQWAADSIVICLGLMMLCGPMWWLNWVDDDVKRLVIITSFIFVFAMGLRAISKPKPFEVLAATAAYAAVLMVFMQKQSSSQK